MKWTIAGLVIVGLIAAISAAVLAVTLKTDLRGQGMLDPGKEEVDIIVATRDLREMMTIDSAAVATQKIRRSEMPQNAMTNAAQVIGRVLLVPVLSGQAFTANQFASSESNLQLASTIPEGNRAMSIMLADETGIENLLYPGSIVDVVASFKFPSAGSEQGPESLSVTLLQGLRVLDVGGKSIVGEEKADKSIDPLNKRGRMVTLLVNTDQAEALQLASTNGKVSLSLRNPLDQTKSVSRGTQLSDLSENLARRLRELASNDIGSQPLVPPTAAPTQANSSSTSTAPNPTTAPMAEPPAKEKPVWLVTILRGASKNVEKFPMPSQEPPN